MKKLILACVLGATVLFSHASPDQRERQEACVLEAQLTQVGFNARKAGMPANEFTAKMQEFMEALTAEGIDKAEVAAAVKAIKQGYAGITPQRAYDACMSKKQV